jgi:hypothetical protein
VSSSQITPATFISEQIIDNCRIDNFNIWSSKAQIKQKINWRSELLSSNLLQTGEELKEYLPFPFTSDFKLKTLETVTDFRSSIYFGDFTMVLEPQLKYINLNKEEILSSNFNATNNYLFFQPKFSLKYDVDYQWNVSLSGNYNAMVSNFSQLFSGIILKDYNSLFRNPDAVNVTRNKLCTFNVGYSNILKGILFNNMTSFTNSVSDYIMSSSIDENGLIQIDAVNLPNERTSFTNATRINKRFFRILKTVLEYKYNKITLDQIFNNIQQETTSTSHSLNYSFSVDNNTWYVLKYEGIANFNEDRSNSFKSSNVFFKHDFSFDFYLSKKSRLNIELETVLTSFSSSDVKNRNTLFNAVFYHKVSKKIFFRTSFNNIFNEKFFKTIQSNANFVSQSQFSLRPRQLTIGLNFSF